MFATIAGGYPVPAGLPDDEALGEVVADQVRCGLGMVSDGVIHRVMTEADCQTIVERWRAADARARETAGGAGVEAPLVKACLAGPATLGAGAAGVDLLRSVLLELFRAGAAVVQVTEEAGAAATGSDHWSRLTHGVTEHVTLAILGGAIGLECEAAVVGGGFASYLFDLVAGPDNWRIAARIPGERGLIVGVADARTERPDTDAVMVWGAQYAASMRGRGPERVGLAPSGGLERLPRPVARAKLVALAEASRKAGLRGPTLARELDPKAVDARSAAMGRYEPASRQRGEAGP
jgi:hypothetical protein